MEFEEIHHKTLYRASEAASILNLSTKSVYRLHAKGVLKGIQLRRSIRILGESLLEFKEIRSKRSF